MTSPFKSSCAYPQFREVSAAQGDLLSFRQASPKQVEQASRFPNPFDQCNRSGTYTRVRPRVLPYRTTILSTQKTLDGIVESKLLLRGFIERLVKADGRGPQGPLKNGRLLSGEERLARLPGSRLPPVPQHDDGGHQPGRRLGKGPRHQLRCLRPPGDRGRTHREGTAVARLDRPGGLGQQAVGLRFGRGRFLHHGRG